MQFKPTYLYIKTHNKTGLKYFGKTTSKNPSTYKGSGKYWKRHLIVHGNDVKTEVIGLFTDPIWCLLYALEFSNLNDIVINKEWANLKVESLDGGWGHITKEHQEKARETWDNKTEEEKIRINLEKARHGELNGMFGSNRVGKDAPMFGKFHTESSKGKMSEAKLGISVMIDKNGDFHSVSCDDPRILSGDLYSANKNGLVVRDKNNKTFRVSLDDPAYLSGELVSVNLGKKRTNKEKIAQSELIKKLKWYNNGQESIRCEFNPGYPWVSGRCKFKENLPPIRSFNNGLENRRMRYPLDESWVEGKVAIRRIWINNGINEKPINSAKLYLYPDWELGRLP